MSATPRRASFDDLRVGQLVAWTNGEASEVGTLTHFVKATDRFEVTMYGDGEPRWYAERKDCERGEVTILRDVPAPPVQVRREDYDALVDLLAWIRRTREANPATEAVETERRIAALIDHADTEATP